MFKSFFHSENIAIDLGTTFSLIYVQGQGIIFNEPSLLAFNQKTGQILAVGEEAKKMIGKTPPHIQISRPLSRGVVSDFEATEQIIRYFIDKAHQRRIFSLGLPRIIIGIPLGITEVEKKAVADAAINAGARRVFLIEELLAAAIGARLSIREPKGNLIIDIGGGTTEVAVISLGGIVCFKNLKIGGDQFNQDIIRYLQENYKLLIGEASAEKIKIDIGEAVPFKEVKEAYIRGRNLVTGLPEELKIDSEDIRKAIEKSLYQIVEAVRDVIEETPAELLNDIMEEGIYLVGGGALLKGLNKLISQSVEMKTNIVEDPLTAVIRGGGIILENFEELKDTLLQTNKELE